MNDVTFPYGVSMAWKPTRTLADLGRILSGDAGTTIAAGPQGVVCGS